MCWTKCSSKPTAMPPSPATTPTGTVTAIRVNHRVPRGFVCEVSVIATLHYRRKPKKRAVKNRRVTPRMTKTGDSTARNLSPGSWRRAVSPDLQMTKVGNAGLHHRQVHLHEVILNAAGFCRVKDASPVERALTNR